MLGKLQFSGDIIKFDSFEFDNPDDMLRSLLIITYELDKAPNRSLAQHPLINNAVIHHNE